MIANKTNRSLNDLTKTITAFDSWEQFEGAMSNNGYCPTLQPHGGRSKAQKAWNAACIELRFKLQEMGYRVFPDTL